MSILYGCLDTVDLPGVKSLILDQNVSSNLAEDKVKVKWNSPTPQALADVLHCEMPRSEAADFYRDPANGWVE